MFGDGVGGVEGDFTKTFVSLGYISHKRLLVEECV